MGPKIDTLEILKKLISYKTVTKPKEFGETGEWNEEWERDYQEFPNWLKNLLEEYGIETKIYEKEGVKNVVARIKFSNEKRSLVFGGHWDVVPPGEGWKINPKPFKAKIVNGKIYGRGACDMKGALATMIKTAIDLSQKEKDLSGEFYLIAVGYEEAGGEYGAKYVLEELVDKQGKKFDYVIVGEPTSLNIRIGRRGVIRFEITAKGKQVHSARANEGLNAIHVMCEIIQRIKQMNVTERELEYFPKTTVSPTILDAGVAPNVIPGKAKVLYDVRNTPGVTVDSILKDLNRALKDLSGDTYTIDNIREVAKPFIVDPNSQLVQTLKKVIIEVTGREPIMNAHGGTSDSRFFAERGIQVAEVGVDDYTLHQPDEWASIETIRKLEKIYIKAVEELLGK
ncbi:MAG: M20 family metallopeptidase [Candidatus Njordarchaeia archaeon]